MSFHEFSECRPLGTRTYEMPSVASDEPPVLQSRLVTLNRIVIHRIFNKGGGCRKYSARMVEKNARVDAIAKNLNPVVR